MKVLFFATLTLVSAIAFAKSGGSQPMTPERFLEESIEYSVALTKASGATVAGVSTQSVDADTMNVVVTTGDGSALTFQCNIVDDFSHGGTVVKKDVICAAL